MTTIDRQTAYTGTKEVAAPLRIDVARLEAYLAANAKGFAGPLTVKQFKGGQSNPTYMLETPARKYVLRRKPPGKLLPSAHAVDREYKAISALHDSFRAKGGPGGALGWPTSGESCVETGCLIPFETGSLTWEKSTGIVASVSAALATTWNAAGGLSSWLGTPLADAVRVEGSSPGLTQEFRNAVGYIKDGGAVVVHKRASALAAVYRATGGPSGDLGWPTSGEACGAGRCTLGFERGALVWNASTGVITRE